MHSFSCWMRPLSLSLSLSVARFLQIPSRAHQQSATRSRSYFASRIAMEPVPPVVSRSGLPTASHRSEDGATERERWSAKNRICDFWAVFLASTFPLRSAFHYFTFSNSQLLLLGEICLATITLLLAATN
uniref:Putative secreted protein n=1 Tax=Anopheles marajoara TaxID=58244 RepID=A0A2M4C7F7_9DIPT